MEQYLGTENKSDKFNNVPSHCSHIRSKTEGVCQCNSKERSKPYLVFAYLIVLSKLQFDPKNTSSCISKIAQQKWNRKKLRKKLPCLKLKRRRILKTFLLHNHYLPMLQWYKDNLYQLIRNLPLLLAGSETLFIINDTISDESKQKQPRLEFLS